MEIFLIGIGFASPAEVRATLETPGYGARLIRDWSSVTVDDSFWGVVVDSPDAPSVREAADELGVEIRGLMPLVLDLPLGRSSGDWMTTIVEVLPRKPPPPLGPLIEGLGVPTGPKAILMQPGKVCQTCGWIGGHDPAVTH